MKITAQDVLGHYVTVYLDGKEESYVTELDLDSGELTRYKLGADGKPIKDGPKYDPFLVRETVYGDIKLTLRQDTPEYIVEYFNKTVPEKNKLVVE